MTSCFLAACESPHPASGLFVFLSFPSHPSPKKKSAARADVVVVVVFQTIPSMAGLWPSAAFCLPVRSMLRHAMSLVEVSCPVYSDHLVKQVVATLRRAC